jgi:hypothetical protein
MRIRRKFLQLTKWTYPYGTEFCLESYLPKGYKQDENENYYIVVGDNPTTMFACHLDTSCSRQEKVTHVQDQKYIRTNGKTILGADDKAGMTVILYMIENKVPGIYYFFVGEEVGCIGSGDLSDQWKELEMFNNIKKVVSFDRKGTTSVITHQLYGRCCSDAFAEELSKRMNEAGEGLSMKPDDTGIMTDSAKFVELVPECTNISVGYYKEHTVDEHQDIEFLQKLCKAVVRVDWETLPVERDPSIVEDWSSWGSSITSDDEEQYEFTESNYTYVRYGLTTKRMLVSKQRVIEEKLLISKWMFNQGSFFGVVSTVWNGHSLWYEDDRHKLQFVGNRVDIMEFVPELRTIPVRHLSDRPSFTKSASAVDVDLSDPDRFKREYLM